MRQVVEGGRAFPAWHSQHGMHGAGSATDGKQAVVAVVAAPCLKPFISRTTSYPLLQQSIPVPGLWKRMESLGSLGDLSSLPSCLSDCQILRKEEDP